MRPKSNKKKLNLYIDDDVIQTIKAYANDNQTTPSTIVTNYIKNDSKFDKYRQRDEDENQISLDSLIDIFKTQGE